MENFSERLTIDQLEHYHKTNPQYFSDIVKYYREYDSIYYKDVVEPYLIELENIKKVKKSKKRTMAIIVASPFIIILILLVVLFIIGLIKTQDPNYKMEMEAQKREKELKARQEEQLKKDKEQKIIAEEIENKEKQSKIDKQKEQETLDNQIKNEQELINQQPRIKDEVSVGNFTYMVSEVLFKKTVGNSYIKKTADGIYLLINLGILNTSKESRTLDNSMFKLIDDNGIEFETSSDVTSTLELSGVKTIFLKKCQPNIVTQGVLVFEVPDSKSIYNLKVSGGFWSGKTATIRLIK